MRGERQLGKGEQTGRQRREGKTDRPTYRQTDRQRGGCLATSGFRRNITRSTGRE